MCDHETVSPGAPGDEALLATLVALAAFRTLFASQKPQWELQVLARCPRIDMLGLR